MCINLCHPHSDQDVEYFPSSESLLALPLSQYRPHRGNHCSDFCHLRLVLTDLNFTEMEPYSVHSSCLSFSTHQLDKIHPDYANVFIPKWGSRGSHSWILGFS